MEYSAARHWGMQTRENTCHSPAPSILAASMSEYGILRMNLVSRNTEKGAKAPGRTMAQRVLRMCSHWETR